MPISPEDARRVIELHRAGHLTDSIVSEVNAGQQRPPEPTGMETAEAQRLAGARAALQAQSTPPGEEPGLPLGQDMMEAGFAAQGGARARPSGGFGPKARDAALDRLFKRAKDGDPAAVFKRPDEQWAAATDRWRSDQG
jgi:hypothetical protein